MLSGSSGVSRLERLKHNLMLSSGVPDAEPVEHTTGNYDPDVSSGQSYSGDNKTNLQIYSVSNSSLQISRNATKRDPNEPSTNRWSCIDWLKSLLSSRYLAIV